MEDKEFEFLLQQFEHGLRTGKHQFFDVNDLCDIIEEYIVEERDEDAATAIAYALRLHPSNPELMVFDARLHVYHEEWDLARRIINAVHGSYDASDYRLVLGDVALHEGNLSGAIRHYELAVHLAQDVAPVYGDIIASLVRERHLDEAVAFAERGLAVYPLSPEVLDSTSIAYSLSGHLSKAIELCNRLIDIDAYNARSWAILGDIYHDHSLFEKALEAYSFVKVLSPADSFTDLNVADCHFMLSNIDAARDLYESVLQHPLSAADRDYALQQLAVCELRLGHDDAYQRVFRLMQQRGGGVADLSSSSPSSS